MYMMFSLYPVGPLNAISWPVLRSAASGPANAGHAGMTYKRSEKNWSRSNVICATSMSVSFLSWVIKIEKRSLILPAFGLLFKRTNRDC